MARISKKHIQTQDTGIRELSAPETAAISGARAISVTPGQIGGLASIFTSAGGPTATSGLWPANPSGGPILSGGNTEAF